jgi:hypothetical protein
MVALVKAGELRPNEARCYVFGSDPLRPSFAEAPSSSHHLELKSTTPWTRGEGEARRSARRAVDATPWQTKRRLKVLGRAMQGDKSRSDRATARLHQVVLRGLLGAVTLVVDRGARRRPQELPADALHARLPRLRPRTVSSPALRRNRSDCCLRVRV